MPEPPPLPPVELAARVGVPDHHDVLTSYLRLGKDAREAVVEALPAGWSFEGKRVLDFGSGAGKVLRHFLEEARVAEFHGCDIHRPSIEWLAANLSPPVHAFVNGEEPPLDRSSGHFDLVLAMSVFTHLSEHSSAWLLELHRVLADDGLLVASFLGAAAYEAFTGKSWEEDRVGMLVADYGQSWDLGGPTVFISPWWLREHWGRAFEVVSLRDGRAPGDHGLVVLRRRAVSPSPEELERPAPGEPRELEALRNQVRRLLDEVGGLRRERERRAGGPGLRARLGAVRRRVAR